MTVLGPFVEVMHAQRAELGIFDLDVLRLKRKISQHLEPRIGCAQNRDVRIVVRAVAASLHIVVVVSREQQNSEYQDTDYCQNYAHELISADSPG